MIAAVADNCGRERNFGSKLAPSKMPVTTVASNLEVVSPACTVTQEGRELKRGYFKCSNPLPALLLSALVVTAFVVAPHNVMLKDDGRVTITYLGPLRFQDALAQHLSEEGFGKRLRYVDPNDSPDITVRALEMEAWSLVSEKQHNHLSAHFQWIDKATEKYQLSVNGEPAEFEMGWDREKGKLIPMTFPGNYAIKAIIQKELEKFEAKKRGS